MQKKSLNSNGIITEIVRFSMKGVILHGGFGTKLAVNSNTKEAIRKATKHLKTELLSPRP